MRLQNGSVSKVKELVGVLNNGEGLTTSVDITDVVGRATLDIVFLCPLSVELFTISRNVWHELIDTASMYPCRGCCGTHRLAHPICAREPAERLQGCCPECLGEGLRCLHWRDQACPGPNSVPRLRLQGISIKHGTHAPYRAFHAGTPI